MHILLHKIVLHKHLHLCRRIVCILGLCARLVREPCWGMAYCDQLGAEPVADGNFLELFEK